MSELVEHILSEDYVSASHIFESRLNDILEMKLFEMKKMLQAESVGGLTKAEIEKRRKAGYVRASEVLPDPRDINIKTFSSEPRSSRKKITAKRKKKINEALSDADIERIGKGRQTAQKGEPFIDKEKEKKTDLKAAKTDKPALKAPKRTSVISGRPGVFKRNINLSLIHI